MSAPIEQEIKKFLENTFLIDFNDFESDADLFRGGIVDSYGFIELVNFLERKFNIKITDEELTSDALTSLDNIIECINNKLESTAA